MQDLITSFEMTRTGDTDLVLVIDRDDPEKDAYLKTISELQLRHGTWFWALTWNADVSGGMVRALNNAAMTYINSRHDVVGFMGDDHRPRNAGWDATIYNAASKGKIVYGDDLLQRHNLATQVAMPTRFVKALGFMAPPVLRHLYVDNYWMALGSAVGLEYVPQAIIEHMHPVAKKAEWDDGYRRVNAGDVYAADHQAFTNYVAAGNLARDVEKVLAVK